MAFSASSRVRPEVVALLERGAAVILQRVEAAAEKEAFKDVKAKETYRGKVRVHARRTVASEHNR